MQIGAQARADLPRDGRRHRSRADQRHDRLCGLGLRLFRRRRPERRGVHARARAAAGGALGPLARLAAHGRHGRARQAAREHVAQRRGDQRHARAQRRRARAPSTSAGMLRAATRHANVPMTYGQWRAHSSVVSVYAPKIVDADGRQYDVEFDRDEESDKALAAAEQYLQLWGDGAWKMRQTEFVYAPAPTLTKAVVKVPCGVNDTGFQFVGVRARAAHAVLVRDARGAARRRAARRAAFDDDGDRRLPREAAAPGKVSPPSTASTSPPASRPSPARSSPTAPTGAARSRRRASRPSRPSRGCSRRRARPPRPTTATAPPSAGVTIATVAAAPPPGAGRLPLSARGAQRARAEAHGGRGGHRRLGGERRLGGGARRREVDVARRARRRRARPDARCCARARRAAGGSVGKRTRRRSSPLVPPGVRADAPRRGALPRVLPDRRGRGAAGTERAELRSWGPSARAALEPKETTSAWRRGGHHRRHRHALRARRPRCATPRCSRRSATPRPLPRWARPSAARSSGCTSAAPTRRVRTASTTTLSRSACRARTRCGRRAEVRGWATPPRSLCSRATSRARTAWASRTPARRRARSPPRRTPRRRWSTSTSRRRRGHRLCVRCVGPRRHAAARRGTMKLSDFQTTQLEASLNALQALHETLAARPQRQAGARRGVRRLVPVARAQPRGGRPPVRPHQGVLVDGARRHPRGARDGADGRGARGGPHCARQRANCVGIGGGGRVRGRGGGGRGVDAPG